MDDDYSHSGLLKSKIIRLDQRALGGAKNPEIGAIPDLAEIWHLD